MPIFTYSAMDEKGKEVRGHIEAADERAAAVKLKETGFFPTNLRTSEAGVSSRTSVPADPAKAGDRGKKSQWMEILVHGSPHMNRKQVNTFTHQMSMLLEAGIPLLRALRVLERQAIDSRVARLIGDIAREVEGGSCLSEGLGQYPKVFDRLYINMIRAGESSGHLEAVLDKLTEYMDKSEKLRRKVKGALAYPVFVLTIAMAITGALMIFVVPKFTAMFLEIRGGQLPGLTQFVMDISTFIITKWYIGLAVIVVAVIAFVWTKRTRTGAYLLDVIAIKTPPFKHLVMKSAVARFGSTLGTLLESGVPMMQALEIVQGTSGNEVVARAIRVVRDGVRDGDGLSRPLAYAQTFPPLMVSMVEVGEETGRLPRMLGRVARAYEDEVDATVDAITALIEPVMIVGLAVLIGTIVIAMFLPIIGMTT